MAEKSEEETVEEKRMVNWEDKVTEVMWFSRVENLEESILLKLKVNAGIWVIKRQ